MRQLPIKDYEGLYTISDTGMVYNIKRNKYLKNVNNKRYLVVLLYKNNKRKMFYVHRLVADAFCEKCNNKKYVNHKDHNRTNNNYKNLEWVTAKENTIHHINSDFYNKKKVSESEKKKIKDRLNKKVKCLITNQIFESINSFSKSRNISLPQASMKLNNVCKNNLKAMLV